MKHDQSARMTVQTLLEQANPVPDRAVADCWRNSAGQATFQAIVRTRPAEEAGRAPRSQNARPPRRGFVIGTAVVAAGVAAGLVIGGVPSKLLGHSGPGHAGPTTGSTTPAVPTRTVTWPGKQAATATGTAPMLQYVLTTSAQPTGTTALPLPPARSVLLKLAGVAEKRAPLTAPAGADVALVVTNEWFFSTAVSGGKAASVVIPEVDKTWTAPNGARRLQTHRGHPLVAVTGSPKTLRAAEAGPAVDDSRYRIGTGPEPLVSKLSLDPAALKRQLLHDDSGDSPPTYRLFDTIRVMNHQIISPRLDAALWRMLATQPDARYLGQVTDRAGRTGDAVAYTQKSGERLVLIISPATGELLDSEDLILSGAPGLHLTAYPAVVGYATFLSQQWTKTLG